MNLDYRTDDEPMYGSFGSANTHPPVVPGPQGFPVYGDQWGRPSGDPWYGIPPGKGGQVPYAPGVSYGDPGTLPPTPSADPEDPRAPQLPTAGGGGGGSSPSTGVAGGQQFFQYPDWTPPNIQWDTFTPPTRTSTNFDYPDFVAPTKDTFQADPGYDFRMDAMMRAIKNQKSSQGVLSTGGTLTDMMSYAGGLASQEFGNVWDRNYKSWDANRNNSMNEWTLGNDRFNDDFTQSLTSYLTKEQAKEQELNRSKDLYTTNLGKEATSYGLNLDTTQSNQAGQNSSFANLLSLYNLMTKNMPTYTPSV